MFTITLLLTTIVLSFVWLFYEFVKTWLFFKRYNIKYEFGVPPFGTYVSEIFGKESWQQTLERIYYKFPNERFVGLTDIGGKVQWLIRDPELLRQIAVRDFSSFVNRINDIHPATDPILGHELTNLLTTEWRQMRTTLTPLLSGQKLKQIAIPALIENNKKLIEFLRNQLNENDELIINFHDLVTRSGVDGFCSTAFTLKTDSLREDGENYGFFDVAQSYFEHDNSRSMAVYRFIIKFPRIMKHLFGKTILKIDDNKFFAQSCLNIADNRIQNQFDRPDYLSLIQSLREGKQIADNGKKYTEIALVSQIFEFFESVITENNLLATFIANRLSERPEIQQRLYDEFTEIKRKLNGDLPDHEALNQMKYMSQVISEALRMCPIAPQLKRRATKPYFFKTGNGEMVPIKPGDAVWLPAFILQNDPHYYPQPNVFDPDRFNDENQPFHTPGTYAPYGMGPRDCVGCQYATNEAKITFYYLILNFIIDKVNENDKFNIKLRRRT